MSFCIPYLKINDNNRKVSYNINLPFLLSLELKEMDLMNPLTAANTYLLFYTSWSYVKYSIASKLHKA